MFTTQLSIVRAFSRSLVRTSTFPNKSLVRRFSLGNEFAPYPIDPKAKLSSFTTLQDKFRLPKTNQDRLPLRKDQRLVCFGDVHGDFNALKHFLTIAGVYDGHRWVGGDSIVVQCGDVLDRGSQELQCFSLLTELSRQAQQEGGRVILLWGNHEALNAAGLFHYTTGDDEYENAVGESLDLSMKTKRWRLQFAGNQPARWAAYEPGGLLSYPLLANMKVSVQVGKTVCVHAGLTKSHLQQWGGLEGMNRMAQDWIQQTHLHVNNNLGMYYTLDQVVQDAEQRAKVTSNTLPGCLGGGKNDTGDSSPVWLRAYSSPPDRPPSRTDAQSLLDACLAELQADRMVMGHTVQSRINAALGGKAWRVDVGASRGVAGGTPEVLEVVSLGDGCDEVVSVLTKHGKIPAQDRQVDHFAATLFS